MKPLNANFSIIPAALCQSLVENRRSQTGLMAPLETLNQPAQAGDVLLRRLACASIAQARYASVKSDLPPSAANAHP